VNVQHWFGPKNEKKKQKVVRKSEPKESKDSISGPNDKVVKSITEAQLTEGLTQKTEEITLSKKVFQPYS